MKKNKMFARLTCKHKNVIFVRELLTPVRKNFSCEPFSQEWQCSDCGKTILRN